MNKKIFIFLVKILKIVFLLLIFFLPFILIIYPHKYGPEYFFGTLILRAIIIFITLLLTLFLYLICKNPGKKFYLIDIILTILFFLNFQAISWVFLVNNVSKDYLFNSLFLLFIPSLFSLFPLLILIFIYKNIESKKTRTIYYLFLFLCALFIVCNLILDYPISIKNKGININSNSQEVKKVLPNTENKSTYPEEEIAYPEENAPLVIFCSSKGKNYLTGILFNNKAVVVCEEKEFDNIGSGTGKMAKLYILEKSGEKYTVIEEKEGANFSSLGSSGHSFNNLVARDIDGDNFYEVFYNSYGNGGPAIWETVFMYSIKYRAWFAISTIFSLAGDEKTTALSNNLILADYQTYKNYLISNCKKLELSEWCGDNVKFYIIENIPDY